MQRIAKNPEQVAEFITDDVHRVLDKDTIYSKKEYYNLLKPLCKPYKHSVYLVTMSLATLNVIKEHQRNEGWKYSLMPKGGMDAKEELEQSRLEMYEETAWLAKFKTSKNKS